MNSLIKSYTFSAVEDVQLLKNIQNVLSIISSHLNNTRLVVVNHHSDSSVIIEDNLITLAMNLQQFIENNSSEEQEDQIFIFENQINTEDNTISYLNNLIELKIQELNENKRRWEDNIKIFESLVDTSIFCC